MGVDDSARNTDVLLGLAKDTVKYEIERLNAEGGSGSLVTFQSPLSTVFTSQPQVEPFAIYRAELESNVG